jgi:hypothetical protein
MHGRPARSEGYPWYDSVWLSRYARATAIIRAVRPEALAGFVDAFQVLRTSLDFRVQVLDRVFDDDTMGKIRRVVRSLRPSDLELHEARAFGRFVVHDHPYFTALQQRTLRLVSEVVGEPVEASYNFLSLYGHLGVCPPHMDSPQAKWTLDLCVNQSTPWPLYVSQVCSWPEATDGWHRQDWEARIKTSPSLRFTPWMLEPGQAVVFSGSSQWHYRDPIAGSAARQSSELLFFHYAPKGSADLLRPERWARLFGVPELLHDS